MYFRKAWLGTRVIFSLYVAVVVLVGVYLLSKGPPYVALALRDGQKLWQFDELLILPLGFIAWLLGGCGIGHDVAQGYGLFLFSRPVLRKSFVIKDSLVALGELMALVTVSIGVSLVRLANTRSVTSTGRVVSLHVRPPSAAIVIVVLSLFLCTAVIFCVTYLCVILASSVVLGLLAAAVLMTSYVWCTALLPHSALFSFGQLPPSLMMPLLSGNAGATSVITGVLSIIERCVGVVVLVRTSQWALDRANV